MSAKYKKVSNGNAGEHCNLLVNDFFSYCDGFYEDVKLIDIRDVSVNPKPDLDGMRKAMARCDSAWRMYCTRYRMPPESQKLFINKVKSEWLKRQKK